MPPTTSETCIGASRFNNQEIYCKNNNLPMFANRTCDHSLSAVRDRHRNSPRDYWLVITDEESMSEHIVSCPICGASFCD